MCIIPEEVIVKMLKESPHDLVCGYAARIIYQLLEKGIKIGAYEATPECIEGIDKNGKYFCIRGKEVPREEQAKLDFSKCAEIGTNEKLAHFFEKEIEISEKRTDGEFFNGVFVGREIAEKLYKAHIQYCKMIIDKIINGEFR